MSKTHHSSQIPQPGIHTRGADCTPTHLCNVINRIPHHSLACLIPLTTPLHRVATPTQQNHLECGSEKKLVYALPPRVDLELPPNIGDRQGDRQHDSAPSAPGDAGRITKKASAVASKTPEACAKRRRATVCSAPREYESVINDTSDATLDPTCGYRCTKNGIWDDV